jgi:erythronate-4-phosphate dehydrogenase
MLILADENIPFAQQVFGALGEVRLIPGRGLSREALEGAEALFVRSVTRVDVALLAGSRVRFVGTATIGTEHVDQVYLAAQGIGFASAPGCNAESVAQYMAAALAFAAGRLGRPLEGATLGIVGAGNCGSRVARVGRALGMEVLLNDPPLAEAAGRAGEYRPLAELMRSDYLALHVPLTAEGSHATRGLIGAAQLAALKPGAVVINACRGTVVDEGALAEALERGHIGGAILDAWAGEPRIDEALLRRALIATPHIAGYSVEGKVNGTLAVYRAACAHFGVAVREPALALPAPVVPRIELEAGLRSPDSILAELALTAYPLQRDDHDLRLAAIDTATPEALGVRFDALRKRYPVRREFAATTVRLRKATPALQARAAQLGFSVEAAESVDAYAGE